MDSLGNGVPSTFVWSAAPVAGVGGISTSPQSGQWITDSLVLNVNASRIIVYTVTPTAIAGGCEGAPFTVTLRLDPLPITFVLPTDVCLGGAANLATQVRDYSFQAVFFEFYDDDPDNGGQLIGMARAYRGQAYPNSRVLVSPPQTHIYYVKAITARGCAEVLPMPVSVRTNCAVFASVKARLEGAYDRPAAICAPCSIRPT
ncbi:MAG: PKD-like domain-containing protein [Bacteroidia bacterium]